MIWLRKLLYSELAMLELVSSVLGIALLMDVVRSSAQWMTDRRLAWHQGG